MRFQLRSKNAYAVLRSRLTASIMALDSSRTEAFPLGSEASRDFCSAEESLRRHEVAFDCSRDIEGFPLGNELASASGGSPLGNEASCRLLFVGGQPHEDILH